MFTAPPEIGFAYVPDNNSVIIIISVVSLELE